MCFWLGVSIRIVVSAALRAKLTVLGGVASTPRGVIMKVKVRAVVPPAEENSA
jgi:hypothetical protein